MNVYQLHKNTSFLQLYKTGRTYIFNMFEINKWLIRFQGFYYRGSRECDRRKLYLPESISYFQLNILYC